MGQKKTAPFHVSNSHTKYGWISSNGLGGDSATDGRMDAIVISPSPFLKKRGDDNVDKNSCKGGGGDKAHV